MNEKIEQLNRVAEYRNWSDVERTHAIASIDNDYGTECIVPIATGRYIHTAAHPNDCSYVRIVQDGFEIAYWSSEEWRDDPELVMGAILGCAKSNSFNQGLRSIKSQEYFSGIESNLDTFQIGVHDQIDDSGTLSVDIANKENDEDSISVVMQVSNSPVFNQPSPSAVVYFDADNVAFTVTREEDQYVLEMGVGVNLEKIQTQEGQLIYKTK